MKVLFDQAKIWICLRGYQELRSACFMARLDYVLMEKRGLA